MAKTRIFQIAKELNISHTDILSFLKTRKIEVSSHMSPVDESIHQMILDEFVKDKEQVDRFRKEQVRKGIHDIRLKEQQKSSKKLQLLSLTDQRELEKKESEKRKQDAEQVEKKKEQNNRKKEEEVAVRKKEADTKKREQDEKEKKHQTDSNKKAKELKKKFKSTKKLRSVNLKNIQSEVGAGTSKQPSVKKGKKNESVHKSVKTKVKGILAKMDSKNKKKVHKRIRPREDEDVVEEGEKALIKVPEFSNVEELGKLFEVTPSEIIQTCIELGMLVTKNQRINWDVVELLADNYGYEAEKDADLGDELFSEEDTEEDIKNATERSPIVTVMGHVDHGKTSLLDYIREAKVAEGESGGITQHIGAYKVKYKDRDITFLDTPGHEAFTAMRARGAQVTDIVILVVAADDAVMPQTIEAISHTKAAGVPMVVAINKMDKPGADPEKVRRSLSEHDVLTESWGGKIQDIEISAKTGMGIDSLMESLLLETDVLELKANKDCLAKGTVIDSRLDKGLGPVGTVLIQKGTLKVGDPFICGDYSGKVRSITNEYGVRIKEAGPSDAIQVQGYDKVPQAADLFAVVENEKDLKRISSQRQLVRREIDQKKMAFSLDYMSSLIKEGTMKTLPMIIKGDVDGSVEALAESLEKLNTAEVGIKVIHKAVGMVTESDVILADASKAIIIGFHVQVGSNARLQARQAGVDIRTYNVIYQAVEELTLALEGMLEPEKIESSIGKAEVLTQFKIPKIGFIAGCKVLEGLIIRNGKARVIRDKEIIAEGLINSLKRHKDDAKEVRDGLECGIGVDGIKKFIEGDIIEVYEIREVKRKLELT
ncbi:MAG: translation initiation factor IF-2 [Candidatus Marinimicrobia bacterium]|nr:translation initiation factor IF-2 [Candidatus Neomarinimicrobiota bacterium]MBT6866454.1 translation initiation factor IF-2 [Candidatus Neomarinimicrobiota bacterium]